MIHIFIAFGQAEDAHVVVRHGEIQRLGIIGIRTALEIGVVIENRIVVVAIILAGNIF